MDGYLSFLWKKIDRFGWARVAFLAIIFLGAFFRVYEFGDWLRFNPDQGRDAIVAFDMTQGEIPLLGPVAGGTEFRLGPATHYISFLSGSIFGWTPPALALPELFFSILTIPLVYLLVARMFGQKMGLVAALLVAVSGYMVRYGRFQWNPNMMPFFTVLLLLSAQAFIDRDMKRRFLWAVAFGIALGISVQLHTFLLVLLPILVVLFFGFLGVRRMLPLGMATVAIGIAMLVNVPQIVSEVKNDFSNMSAFLDRTNRDNVSASNASERIGRDALCHIRANAFILSGLGHTDDCNRFIALMKKKKPLTHPVDIAHAVFEILFTVGGILLLGWFAWKETNIGRRFLLIAILVYSGVLFALIIPVANEIAMRYFLASAFVPFVLLGVWGKFLLDRGVAFRWGFGVFVVMLLVSNGWFLKKEFDEFSTGKVSDGDTAIWGEMKPLVEFVSENTASGETAYLDGMRDYRKRFYKGVAFPLHIEGKTLIRWEDEGLPEDSGPVFFVRKKTKAFDEATEIDGYPIIDKTTSGRVSVFLLRR